MKSFVGWLGPTTVFNEIVWHFMGWLGPEILGWVGFWKSDPWPTLRSIALADDCDLLFRLLLYFVWWSYISKMFHRSLWLKVKKLAWMQRRRFWSWGVFTPLKICRKGQSTFRVFDPTKCHTLSLKTVVG